MNNSIIEFENVSLIFKLYFNTNPTLKDSFLSVIHSRNNNGVKTKSEDFYALKNVSFDIYEGTKLGIIGLNGAGKSTLLKIIAGIYAPHSGKVIVRGRVTPLIELGAGVNPEYTGRENIYLYGAIHGLSPKEMKTKEDDIIEFAELGHHIDVPAKYYSSGMFSRLIFSIACMTNPDILIVDEVFSAGDARFVQKAMNRTLELFDQSQAVLFVSHGLDQVLEICNRVIVLHKGEIINDGIPEEMIDFYLKEIVAQKPSTR
ncbi:MAG: ABC transporter ATP-binding protein [Anaerolineales bacterium]|nr:ABC transporter ATP-binding protein [Anaerolineales bacterium]